MTSPHHVAEGDRRGEQRQLSSDAPRPLNDALNATMRRAADRAPIVSRSARFVADTFGGSRFARVRAWTVIAVIRSNAGASVAKESEAPHAADAEPPS